MGQQIGIAFSQREELEFCEAIRVKFDIWSVPRFFKKAQGIPKPLGEYMGMDQKMFFETERINVKDNTHQITSTNWETMVETLTDDYHLYSNDPFYIDWDTANIEKYVNENHKEYLGKIIKSKGQYDAFAGKVTNFTYSINDDATYEVSITISAGNTVSLALPIANVSSAAK
jgi:phenylpropionate dioxygenase-like ring-hydroxylating dioxygenase large terminal subunit